MTEYKDRGQIFVIETSLSTHQYSLALGNCTRDAEAAIGYLTTAKVCQKGEVKRLRAGDFDSPVDLLTIFAVQLGGLAQVPYHDIALMDMQYVVDLGRNPGNRVFQVESYYSMIARLQR